MPRVHIPAPDPEPIWPKADEVADLIAALVIVIGGCWVVGIATLF
jgi:hypothetical protein